MLKAYKYRIYPNSEQNKDLDIKKVKYPTPAQYKKEFPWLKEVDSLALANAQISLNKAYKNFFRDKSIGFPKFKSKKSNYYSYTTNNQKGTVYIQNSRINLPKLKSMIKIKQHREFNEVSGW
ncbi:putative transposase [Clostridium tepidiprofundi DSM 19306]|uniref:Putative transposase n=1 Tax=Clostridium tepidiprofundi DSM 19306 TaxID=1121338 RepID=A0A151ATM4_9CLOT|nr:putative transposase [Clostridium tepidiprofundi DSM 19306]